MKVGLLVCDEVKTIYQKEFGDYPAMFQTLFPDYEFIGYEVRNGEFPADVNECEVYMATGSAHSVYENLEWIRQSKAFIRTIYASNKYFIGFCFGHQLMVEALGGKVEKANVGWCVGVHEFDVLQIERWMRPTKSSVNFLMMCQDQVTQLPPNAVRLAGNKECPNAILRIGERMLSIQGHPEFTKAYDKVLMETRVKKMGEEKVANGIASLEKELDTSLFRQWVSNFIETQ